ncbi:MAG: hypothetical protein ACE5IR_11870 [bacterium]
MSIERFEIGSMLNTISKSYRIGISARLTGITILNNIVPIDTKLSLDDSAFQFEAFPYQTIEIPPEFNVRNSITIHQTNTTIAGGGTTVQTDLPFKVLAFFEQRPVQIPVMSNVDSFVLRNDGSAQTVIQNMNFQNAMIFASTVTTADIQSFRYQVGFVEATGIWTNGYFHIRGDSKTSEKTIHLDYPFNDLRFIPSTTSINTDFRFMISAR